MRIPFFLLATALLFCFLPLVAGPLYLERKNGRSPSSNLIKVRLSRPVRALLLRCSDGFSCFKLQNSRMRLGIEVTNLRVVLSNRRIYLDGRPIAANAVLLRPVQGLIWFKKRSYRGDMMLIREKSGISLINRIGIESYLKGVLPHEINHRWPIEALKAQAVAARSYAIVKMRENGNRIYDLDNSAYSQVYKGSPGEKQSTSDAVEQTRGVVLQYGGKTAVGFFHASCGGRTEASGYVWSSSIPYLQSRRSPWCSGTKYFRWGVVLGRGQISASLGIRVPLASAAVLSRTPSGRVRLLLLRDRNGRKYRYSGKAFRRKIGYNRLRSRWFRVRVRGPYLQILGRGWGHGVGLCQWCAFGMAEKGFTALQILAYFYPGTELGRYRLRTEW